MPDAERIAERIADLEKRCTDLENRYIKLSNKVDGVERDTAFVVTAIKAAQDGDSGSNMATSADIPWHCEKCNRLLGIVDTTTNELRIGQSKNPIYVTPGTGGKTAIACPGCRYMNELTAS